MSATSQRIIEILKTRGEVSAAEICQALSDQTRNARGNLRRLEEAGEIICVGYDSARNVHGDPMGGPRTRIYALAP